MSSNTTQHVIASSKNKKHDRTPPPVPPKPTSITGRSSPAPSKSNDEVRIAVMGATGVGKSTFINLVSSSRLRVSDSLQSCTDKVELSQPFLVDGRRVRLVDTPGFDDTNRSDADILGVIAEFLATEYNEGRRLTGVIYVHNISSPRMGGSALRNLVMFQKLCGTHAFKNVLIVTTRWSQVDPAVGASREEELKSKSTLFKPLVDEGAHMVRHDGIFATAQSIIINLLHNEPTPLLIQRELIEEGKLLTDTQAGIELRREILDQTARNEQELRELYIEMEEVGGETDEVRREIEADVQALQERIAILQAEAEKLGAAPPPPYRHHPPPLPRRPAQSPAPAAGSVAEAQLIDFDSSGETMSSAVTLRPQSSSPAFRPIPSTTNATLEIQPMDVGSPYKHLATALANNKANLSATNARQQPTPSGSSTVATLGALQGGPRISTSRTNSLSQAPLPPLSYQPYNSAQQPTQAISTTYATNQNFAQLLQQSRQVREEVNRILTQQCVQAQIDQQSQSSEPIRKELDAVVGDIQRIEAYLRLPAVDRTARVRLADHMLQLHNVKARLEGQLAQMQGGGWLASSRRVLGSVTTSWYPS